MTSRRKTKRSGVYQIINEINGKSYVGSSKDIDNRWDHHRYSFKKPMKNCSVLWSAVQKYGIENFTFIVLEECAPVKETLLALEQYYIDTLLPEYNLLKVAGSRLGAKHSPETIAKLIGRKHTDEWKQERASQQSEHMLTEARRQQSRDARQGKTYNELFGDQAAVVKAKIAASHVTNPRSPAGWNRAKSKSGEYGVAWDNARQKWMVRMNNKMHGRFASIEEAIAHRDAVLTE